MVMLTHRQGEPRQELRNMMLRLTPEQHDRLRERAEAEQRSMAVIIRRALERELNREEVA